MDLWLKIVLGAVLFALLSGVVITFIISSIIFKRIFIRNSDTMLTRGNSEPGANPDHDAMHVLAEEWYEKHRYLAREVSIENDGLKLAGQYFDFGFDRCAVILAGRTEASVYSTVFAQPYVDSGYNILVPDNRAHGFSEGKLVTMGYRERFDLLAWMEYAHDTLGCREIVYHGVCVGAATGVYAATEPNAPDYLKGITVEGLFENFYEVLRRRILARGRKTFPVLQELWLMCRVRIGVNFLRFSPERRIGSMKYPILFIHSKEDVSSLPESGERLFAKCGSENKRIVWMESGSHSHIRLTHRDEYDGAVRSFLESL